MYYKIKKFTQESNECESEFIERVRNFFQTYIKLENFINDVYYIVNNLNKSVFGITTAWSYYFKDELLWLKDLIKNNEKRHRN